LKFNIYRVKTTEEAKQILNAKVINQILPKNCNNFPIQPFIITNGADNALEFVQFIRDSKITTPILVYCMKVEYHKTWAAKFNNVTVTSSGRDVIAFIEKNAAIC